MDRLHNESTRLPAVKAFTRIAQSPSTVPVDISCVLEPLLSELTSYMRKSNRQLRHASLAAIEVKLCWRCATRYPVQCVAPANVFTPPYSPHHAHAPQAVMSRYGAEVSASAVMAAVDEVAGLVSDADLLTTPLALQFCLTLLPKQPHLAPDISSKFLPSALQLVKSPLLQVRLLLRLPDNIILPSICYSMLQYMTMATVHHLSLHLDCMCTAGCCPGRGPGLLPCSTGFKGARCHL